MVLILWCTGSALSSFFLGWLLGTYGYVAERPIEPNRLIAAHLMEVNRRNIQ